MTSYQAVPLQDYQEPNMFEVDPEEEKIQKLRDKKVREDYEKQISRRIDAVINQNNSRLKNFVNNKFPGRQYAMDSNGHVLNSQKGIKKVNANNLPKRVQNIQYNISENNNSSDALTTKSSFLKATQSEYSQDTHSKKVSIHSIKENISEATPTLFQAPSMPEHQIEFNAGSHPNNLIIPKKGVTLITGPSSQPTNAQYARIQHGEGKRMSRAQYAATIANQGLNFERRLKKMRTDVDSGQRREIFDIEERTEKTTESLATNGAKEGHQSYKSEVNRGSQGVYARKSSGRNYAEKKVRTQAKVPRKSSGRISMKSKIHTNPNYDVSALLTDHSVLPTSKITSQPKKYSTGFAREKISRRVKNGGKVTVNAKYQ